MEDTMLKFGALKLLKGSHEKRADGMCAMEAAAWLAGEQHSDSPACVSPILREFMIRLNDDLDDEGRQRLKPYIPRVLGTAGDGKDELRGWLAADWLVRVYTPTWLELAGLTESAAALRALAPLRSAATLNLARPILAAAQTRSAAAWAVWAARAATRDAVDDTRAAEGTAWAAWAATRDAAWAVWAAGDAARDAARYAAWAVWAAGEKLAPTRVALQASALELLEAMIDPPAEEI